MTLEELRDYWKVPARRGMRVEMDGKPGTIVSGQGGYIRVRFDGQRIAMPCHARWRMTYIHPDGRRESFGMEPTQEAAR